MNVPLEVTYRGIRKTPVMEELIREKADKLIQVCPHLSSCRVVVEKPQSHQRRGRSWRVRIDMTVPPGHELVTRKESNLGEMHEPVESVIRDAFQASRRQLRDLYERQRGEVKRHMPENQNAGVISRLFDKDGYGFLVAEEDGRQVYFHRNSVVNEKFEDLKIGDGVRFVAVVGEEGDQASTVERTERQRKI